MRGAAAAPPVSMTALWLRHAGLPHPTVLWYEEKWKPGLWPSRSHLSSLTKFRVYFFSNMATWFCSEWAGCAFYPHWWRWPSGAVYIAESWNVWHPGFGTRMTYVWPMFGIPAKCQALPSWDPGLIIFRKQWKIRNLWEGHLISSSSQYNWEKALTWAVVVSQTSAAVVACCILSLKCEHESAPVLGEAGRIALCLIWSRGWAHSLVW